MYLYLGNERVVVGEWIVDVISFQKIFGLCCLKCHIVEIWMDVTFEDNGRRKCEYRARIREAGFAIFKSNAIARTRSSPFFPQISQIKPCAEQSSYMYFPELMRCK